MSNIILPFTFDHEETTVRYAGNTSYFIEAVGLDKIKIGRARDVAKRLATLQTGSAVPLKLLATTDTIPERELHRRFRRERISGEWFHRCPEILALIDEINGQAAPIAEPAAEPDTDSLYFTPKQVWAAVATFLVPIAFVWFSFALHSDTPATTVAQPSRQELEQQAEQKAERNEYAKREKARVAAELRDIEWRFGGGRQRAMEEQHRKMGGYWGGNGRHLEWIALPNNDSKTTTTPSKISSDFSKILINARNGNDGE